MVAQFRANNADLSFEIKTLHNEGLLRSRYEWNSDLAVGDDTPRHPRLSDILVGSGGLVLLYRKENLPDAPPCLTLDIFKHKDLDQADRIRVRRRPFLQRDPNRPAAPIRHIRYTYYVAAALVRQGVAIAVVD